jgi:hypothetical protein
MLREGMGSWKKSGRKCIVSGGTFTLAEPVSYSHNRLSVGALEEFSFVLIQLKLLPYHLTTKDSPRPTPIASLSVLYKMTTLQSPRASPTLFSSPALKTIQNPVYFLYLFILSLSYTMLLS